MVPFVLAARHNNYLRVRSAVPIFLYPASSDSCDFADVSVDHAADYLDPFVQLANVTHRHLKLGWKISDVIVPWMAIHGFPTRAGYGPDKQLLEVVSGTHSSGSGGPGKEVLFGRKHNVNDSPIETEKRVNQSTMNRLSMGNK